MLKDSYSPLRRQGAMSPFGASVAALTSLNNFHFVVVVNVPANYQLLL